MIDRRQFLIRSALATAAVALPWRPQALFALEAEAAFRELRDGAGIFVGQGGTIGWYTAKDAVVVIDSQFPDSARACLEGVRARSEHPIDALINTHHHQDHVAGNGVFRPHAGKIVAHKNVPELQKKQAAQRKVEKDQTYADTTFEKEWKLAAGKETVTARHFGPAHTGGDIVIHFEKANVVHMGDLVFNRWFPFIDMAGGASTKNWIQVLDRVVAAHGKDTIYIFGHGKASHGVTGKAEDVTQMRSYLSALWDHAEKQLAAGRSAEEIASLAELPGFGDYESPSPEMLSLKANLVAVCQELRPG